MGFGNRLAAAKTVSDIESIERDINLIQAEFDFNATDELTRDVISSCKKTILAFSDSVIVNIPLESEATAYSGTFDLVMGELTGFAYAQGSCVLKNLFLRGGLDLGWWYHKESTLISQSMARASLERRRRVPRLVGVRRDPGGAVA